MYARLLFTVTFTTILLAISTLAMAAPQISLETIVEKQATILVDGKQQVQYSPSDTTVPGDILRFTLIYKNSGDAEATDVVLNNPVPQNTVYLDKSATGEEVGELTFSIDGGVTYDKAAQLMYTFTRPDGSTENRIALAEQYTHIRWRINSIPAGGTGQVSFNVLIL